MAENTTEKVGLGTKVKGLLGEFKTHWKTPPEGRFVPYKEYVDITLSVGANYAGSKILEYLTFAAGCYLMMYHYKLPYLTYSIINLINMPLNYVWTVLTWYVSDNLGFMPKKTEKKLYVLYFALIAVGLVLICAPVSDLFNPSGAFVTYLNGLQGISARTAFKILGTHILYNGWSGARNIFWRKVLIPKFGRYKYVLYCNALPKLIMVILMGWLPFYNLPDVTDRVWIANLLFAIFNLFPFENVIEKCSQNISPNLRERILVRSYPIKISHLFWSIMAAIIPAIIGALRYKWEDINVFKYVVPGVFLVFVIITMLLAGNVKERIPQPPIQKKVHIGFWDGMFGVMNNKYRLIGTVVSLFDALGDGMLKFQTILYLYTFRLTGLSYSLLVSLVSFMGTPPDLLSPYFIKRFSYKQMMIFYQLSRAIGNAIIVCCYIFLKDNVTLCGLISVIVLMFMEATKTVPVTFQRDMDVRVNDYQMYLSGERLESYSGVYSWFTSPITSLIGLIIPILLLKFGFNSNWDVLFVDASRTNIIVVPLILDVIGYLLMTLPYLFWDYDSNKQNQVMAVLRRREQVTEKIALEEGIELDEGISLSVEQKSNLTSGKLKLGKKAKGADVPDNTDSGGEK